MLKSAIMATVALAFVAWGSAASAVPVANHMACYQVKDLKIPAKFANTGLYTYSTQVDSGIASKCKPKFLCVPASKDGGPIVDAALHYMCYQCKGTQPAITYGVTDQFGFITVQTKKFKLLCNPADKM